MVPAGKPKELMDRVILPTMADQKWNSIEIDELISLLVKIRSSGVPPRPPIPTSALVSQQYIGAGLVTGWFRENPLLNNHTKTPSTPSDQDPETLRKYRKDLITSAMGSYAGTHERRRNHKYVRGEFSDQEFPEQRRDVVVEFDEEKTFKSRAKSIQSMLNSSEAEVSVQYNSTLKQVRQALGSGSENSEDPDGIRPTFRRSQVPIRSMIAEGSTVVFY